MTEETLNKVKEWFENTKIYLEGKQDTEWSDEDQQIRRICIEAVSRTTTNKTCRLSSAINYLRGEMENGFYAPDKEYIETLIFYAQDGLKQQISNTEILIFISGWQGGTINQIADFLGVTPIDIASADYDRMQDLMRLAQRRKSEVNK